VNLKPCPKCKADAEEIIAVSTEENGKMVPCKPYRKGWYCFECGAFDQAIGRERIVWKIDPEDRATSATQPRMGSVATVTVANYVSRGTDSGVRTLI
jgi:hypothetical protein